MIKIETLLKKVFTNDLNFMSNLLMDKKKLGTSIEKSKDLIKGDKSPKVQDRTRLQVLSECGGMCCHPQCYKRCFQESTLVAECAHSFL